MPVVSGFAGAITATYAATFDYAATFTLDKNGYLNNTSDLAWIELWATDHGQTDYFDCGKTKALGVPMSMIGSGFPTYSAVWKGLGEGRAYDLYLKYRLIDGSESQFSAIVASNVTNLGIGVPTMSANPSLSTPPTINGTPSFQYYRTGDVSFDVSISFKLTLPSPDTWIKYVVIYVLVNSVGETPALKQATAISHFPPGNGDYSINNAWLLNVPALNVLDPNISGYLFEVAYEDNQGNISATSTLGSVSSSNVNCANVTVLANNISWATGSGAPGAAPATTYGFYVNTSTGGLYFYNGSAWQGPLTWP